MITVVLTNVPEASFTCVQTFFGKQTLLLFLFLKISHEHDLKQEYDLETPLQHSSPVVHINVISRYVKRYVKTNKQKNALFSQNNLTRKCFISIY